MVHAVLALWLLWLSLVICCSVQSRVDSNSYGEVSMLPLGTAHLTTGYNPNLHWHEGERFEIFFEIFNMNFVRGVVDVWIGVLSRTRAVPLSAVAVLQPWHCFDHTLWTLVAFLATSNELGCSLVWLYCVAVSIGHLWKPCASCTIRNSNFFFSFVIEIQVFLF